ncbi:DNA-3-methyladenine glycosylase 2 family protein [Pseudohongiella sp.]|uniref:HTH araC/xylS-type domain-containing protein n=1 Tax=marine sediment metagenome TaxID=412755 RepID=A0A0F9VV81_9ZZZZ|nr:DNA-3-methyladenine glycosylase 2 [Pseudohongiella sp.]HDZ08018.1 DNA-3-methyladenine glycosylase 2 family protein [Pseudohongiella sp.]HEA64139.1 DNA-3-methyladenine glycosylase 2 family protein [Pseudohongiella sp.]
MNLDADHCYPILQARDARFDGLLYVGVSSTGIYCRPVCTVRTPGRDRCSYFANAASAEAAGFRPCLRCRPELAPGRAPVDSVRQSARVLFDTIQGGALADGSMEDLAIRFGLSSRQLRRIVQAEYGVNPLAIERTRRLLLAKQLLTDSSLRVVDVAYACGFASVRQFNRLFVEAYRMNPSALRQRQSAGSDKGMSTATETGIPLQLGFRGPLAWEALSGFLAGRGSGRTECQVGNQYVRTIRIGTHSGWIAAQPTTKSILKVDVSPSLLPVLPALQMRLRRLFDLDASPLVIDSQLGENPRLRPLVERTPGLRVPGTIDGFELALRAIVGQQVSVKSATTVFGRFVERFGEPLETPFPSLDRLAPVAEDVAAADVAQLIALGLTGKRAATVLHLARAIASGQITLDSSADAEQTRAQLLALPGIGPWTTEYIAMRALGDPDAFPASDLALLKIMGTDKPKMLQAEAEAWRPWRAYAAIHVWHSLNAGG